MSQEPEQEGRPAGGGPGGPIPPMPGYAPRVGPEGKEPAGGGHGDAPRGPVSGRWRRTSARARVVTVACTVGALALGGTVAFAAASDPSGPDATPSASSSATPSPHRHGPGLGARGGGAHGEATVKDRDTGKWIVRIWQRGTVEKVSGDQVTVKSADGTSWTWTVGSGVTVRGDGGGSGDTGAGALKKGDQALLVGTRADSGKRTATAAFAGSFQRGDGGFRHRDGGDGGFPGHGKPWNRDGHRPNGSESPSPSSPSPPSPNQSGNGTAT